MKGSEDKTDLVYGPWGSKYTGRLIPAQKNLNFQLFIARKAQLPSASDFT